MARGCAECTSKVLKLRPRTWLCVVAMYSAVIATIATPQISHGEETPAGGGVLSEPMRYHKAHDLSLPIPQSWKVDSEINELGETPRGSLMAVDQSKQLSYPRNLGLRIIDKKIYGDRSSAKKLKKYLPIKFNRSHRGIKNYKIQDSQIIKLSNGDDAILMFGSYRLGDKEMSHIHVAIPRATFYYLLTYTDMHSLISTSSPSYVLFWNILQQIQLPPSSILTTNRASSLIIVMIALGATLIILLSLMLVRRRKSMRRLARMGVVLKKKKRSKKTKKAVLWPASKPYESLASTMSFQSSQISSQGSKRSSKKSKIHELDKTADLMDTSLDSTELNVTLDHQLEGFDDSQWSHYVPQEHVETFPVGEDQQNHLILDTEIDDQEIPGEASPFLDAG